MIPPPVGVKVRMYRNGLGDCFLMAFPRAKTPGNQRDAFYLLLDCGVYKGTPEPKNQTWIAQIVADIKDATAGHLDLLIITHEHWDHVSAFHPSQSQQVFEKDIQLGTLWMAWTEDLSIKLAKDLHEGRKAARAALAHSLARMNGLGAANNGTKALVEKVLAFFGGDLEPAKAPKRDAAKPGASATAGDATPGPLLGAAVLGAKKSVLTEEAMEWIRDTYGKDKTDFLHPGDGPLKLDGVDGARVYVLGPPEDRGLIKKYNPSASGDEVYPKAMAAAIEASFFAAFGVVPTNVDALPDSDDVKEAKRLSLPFDEQYQVSVKEARTQDFFKENYYHSDTSPEWRKIEMDWLEAAGEFALQLDSATNNTSLAFALEIGAPGSGNVLLFPGDAQVGNWLSWFGKVDVGKETLGKDMNWKVNGKVVNAEDLLRRTVLYKVGHHGSHNATLRGQGLELMGPPHGAEGFAAMLPVDEHVARKLAHYGEMPLKSLVKELLIRTNGRLARSDEGDTPEGEDSTLAAIPGAPARTTSFLDDVTKLYFEYTVAPPQ
jgi:hypothetical protein